MKSIGYVLADFPVLSETFVGNEMRAIAAHGHAIVPIVMNLRDGPAQTADRTMADNAVRLDRIGALAAAAELVRIGPGALKAMDFLRKQELIRPRSLLFNSLKIASVARRHGCMHLHAHFSGGAAAHAILAARWIGASVSFVCHGHDVYAEPEDLELKLASADRIVAVCKDMEDDLRILQSDAQLAMVSCGTEPADFLPSAEFGKAGRLLFIGRLVEQKGIDDLIAALAIMRSSLGIDIVGDGPLRPELEALVASIGLGPERVRFLGPRSREWLIAEAPRYLGLVAPFKIAPDGSRDTGPIVVKEAMAMGLPVVATRFMGLKETITEDTGILTPVADPVALAHALDDLATRSIGELRAMGARGRARIIEQFSMSKQAEALSKLFEAA